MKTIKTEELKELFKMVIDQLEVLEDIKEIEIDRDMYRFIPTDKWESFEQEPLIGSLEDDLEGLQKILNDTDRAMSYVDFDRIASILHFISEKLCPVGDKPFENKN